MEKKEKERKNKRLVLCLLGAFQFIVVKRRKNKKSGCEKQVQDPVHTIVFIALLSPPQYLITPFQCYKGCSI